MCVHCIFTVSSLILQLGDPDAQCNTVAAHVAAGHVDGIAKSMAQLGVKPSSSFETGYNLACGLLEAG